MKKQLLMLVVVLCFVATPAFAVVTANHFENTTSFNTTIQNGVPTACAPGYALTYINGNYQCKPNFPSPPCNPSTGAMTGSTVAGGVNCTPNNAGPNPACPGGFGALGFDANGNVTGCVLLNPNGPTPVCSSKQGLTGGFGAMVCGNASVLASAPIATFAAAYSQWGWCTATNPVVAIGAGTEMSVWCECDKFCQAQNYAWGLQTIFFLGTEFCSCVGPT